VNLRVVADTLRWFGLGAIIFALSGAACSSAIPSTSGGSMYQDVLLENLATAPSRYHNKRIRVVGVCQIQFEGTVLWLNDEARTHGRLDRAIWLRVGWPPSPDVEVLSGQHVVVEAKFDATQNGHLGCCKGMRTRNGFNVDERWTVSE
jgi:hypothetical protein